MGAAFAALIPILPFVLLVSIRIGVALASLPAPLGSVAPPQVRAALGLFLAIALSVPHAGDANDLFTDPFWLAGAALGEALVGAAIGLSARLCLAAAEAAGEIVGGSIGLGFAQIADPSTGQEAAVTARILELLAVLVFFATSGHHAVIAALGQSLEVAPPGAAWTGALSSRALTLGSDLVASGLRIASPVMGTMLIVQLGVAITSRAAPRLQVFSISFAIAASVGLLTLVVAMPAITEAITAQMRALPSALGEIVRP